MMKSWRDHGPNRKKEYYRAELAELYTDQNKTIDEVCYFEYKTPDQLKFGIQFHLLTTLFPCSCLYNACSLH